MLAFHAEVIVELISGFLHEIVGDEKVFEAFNLRLIVNLSKLFIVQAFDAEIFDIQIQMPVGIGAVVSGSLNDAIEIALEMNSKPSKSNSPILMIDKGNLVDVESAKQIIQARPYSQQRFIAANKVYSHLTIFSIIDT
jgi:hypothetical protein